MRKLGVMAGLGLGLLVMATLGVIPATSEGMRLEGGPTCEAKSQRSGCTLVQACPACDQGSGLTCRGDTAA